VCRTIRETSRQSAPSHQHQAATQFIPQALRH
jgi:hypothetical protein